MKTFWLSFVKDGSNAGCCIVDANDSVGAVLRSHELNINPGGEVMIYEIESDCEDVEEWGKNRLVSPGELYKAGYVKLSDMNDDDVSKIESHEGVSTTCEHVNNPNSKN